LLVLFGFIIAGVRGIDAVPAWLGSGLILGVLLSLAYVIALRFSIGSILVAVGVLQLLGIVRQGAFAGYPNAVIGAAIAFIVTAAAAWFWYERISGERPRVM
jgi:hypothetical protein